MKNILIVDMQKGFINKNNEFLVERINNYLADNCFDNVFYTRYINKPNSPFVNILKWNGMLNQDEQSIVVNQKDHSTIFTKEGYGLSQNMITTLKDKGIESIEVCGTDKDACVMAIAYNLFDAGIKPIILSSLCASSSSNKNIHNNSIEIMKRSFGLDNVK